MFTKCELLSTPALAATAVVGLLSLLVTPIWAQNAQPKYSADVPSYITTPDTVETRIGTLRFKHGAPDEKTVKTVYDQIDFSRGIEAFLTGMSATSIYALCDGFNHTGIKTNQGIGIRLDGCALAVPDRQYYHRLCCPLHRS